MEFFKSVQVSLNYIADEGDGTKLRFRTLNECGVDALMHHQNEGIQKIVAAARKTTPDSPFLQMDFHSQNLILTGVQNRMSQQFATGYLDYDMQIPCVRKKYWLGLTCEKPRKDQRFAIKLRVMVASDGLLTHTDWEDPPGFERPTHKARWDCLKEMARILQNDNEIKNKKEKEKDWYKQLQLREIVIFRPLHFPDEEFVGANIPQLSEAENYKPIPHLKMRSTISKASESDTSSSRYQRKRSSSGRGSMSGVMTVRLRREISDEGKVSVRRDGSIPDIQDDELDSDLLHGS